MLMEAQGERFLAAQGFPWIAVAPDGALRGPAVARD
jgi:hypothetical protein